MTLEKWAVLELLIFEYLHEFNKHGYFV